jgi:membrane protein
MQVPGFYELSLMTVLKKSIKNFFDDDMTSYAAALAFHVILSLFPFIIFLIALLGFFDLSDFFEWLRQQARFFLPQQALEQLNNVIDEIGKPQGGLLSFGIVFALWTASSGVRAMMNALNVAFDVKERRPAWKRIPLSIFYTLGIATILILATALLMVGPQAIQWFAHLIRLEQLFVTLWTWLRWPSALLLLIATVAIIYYAAPNYKQRFRFITPGAVIAVFVWIAASLGFNVYLQNFANYSAMYGSIGTIIALLLYFFLSAAVLLYGAEVNSVIEHHAQDREKIPLPLRQA